MLSNIVFTQDPPPGFEYNQGYNQSFYFFLDINIDGEPLSEDDWIGAFKTYDETKDGECTQEEINFDETLGGMCSERAQKRIGEPLQNLWNINVNGSISGNLTKSNSSRVISTL